MLSPKLSFKFYMASFLLLCAILFCCYGIHFLNTNEILMEDSVPMDADTKLIFTILMSLIVASWVLSLATLVRQMLFGYAFRMDEQGIHNTATAVMLLAFLVVVPIKRIPYEAIERVTEENGLITVRINKSKIQALPILKPLVCKEYHFFSGFAKVQSEDIQKWLDQCMN